MKKKRIISLILATTMAATVVVSGCGKSGDSEKTDDGKKKTVLIWQMPCFWTLPKKHRTQWKIIR